MDRFEGETVTGVTGLPYFQVFSNAGRARKKTGKCPQPVTPVTDYANYAGFKPQYLSEPLALQPSLLRTCRVINRRRLLEAQAAYIRSKYARTRSDRAA